MADRVGGRFPAVGAAGFLAVGRLTAGRLAVRCRR